ncbi:LamG domain-containing protein [Sphingomonas sp. Leaf339]|uniref:LamG domain-containing protein n=1 Tax=Sphingomonas sp. Leaf339 TaxID=1736343 RepID=UPI00138ED697|nr:LamG domain-containing protein [Sphingomonas sp. Leaf339]
MSQLTQSNRTYQRETKTDGGPAKGKGRIPVTLNVTTAGPIYARTRSIDGNDTILQAAWLAVTNAPVANDSVDIPGVEARTGKFYLDTAASASGPWKLGTVPVGMGRVILMTGQSLQVRNFFKTNDTTTIAGAGITVTQKGAVLGSGDTTTNSAWVTPSDAGPATSAGAAALINMQSDLFGVQIGLVFCAVGNTSLTTWQAGQANSNSAVATLSQIDKRFEAHWQYQGHSDIDKGYAAYWALLKGWMDIVAANTVGTAPARYFTAIPNINSSNFGPEPLRAVPRGVAEDYAKATGGTYLPMNDIAMVPGEGIHAIQSGSVRQVSHFHRATRQELGLVGDKGPVMGVPVVSGLTVTVPVILPAGATTLALGADPKSRFAVRERGSNDVLTSSALAYNAPNLVFTLSAAPSNRIEVSPFLTSGDDGTVNMIYDNSNDGDGIPVGRQLFTPGRPLLSRPKISAVLSQNVAFAAGKFGQGRSAGQITLPAGTMPSTYGGFTFEMVVTPSSVVGGVQVLLGVEGYGYFQQDGATIGVPNGESVPILVGQSYHIVFFVDPGGNSKGFYVNSVPLGFGNQNNPTTAGQIWIGHLNGNAEYTRGVIDEVAMFYAPFKYPVAGFTTPTAPYVGNEDGLLHLWHLNGDGADSCSLNS